MEGGSTVDAEIDPDTCPGARIGDSFTAYGVGKIITNGGDTYAMAMPLGWWLQVDKRG